MSLNLTNDHKALNLSMIKWLVGKYQGVEFYLTASSLSIDVEGDPLACGALWTILFSIVLIDLTFVLASELTNNESGARVLKPEDCNPIFAVCNTIDIGFPMDVAGIVSNVSRLAELGV